jgi:hypothetical protein
MLLMMAVIGREGESESLNEDQPFVLQSVLNGLPKVVAVEETTLQRLVRTPT